MLDLKNMMRISVVVPTYKPDKYIWECLDSLYGQKLPQEEFEVLLILNGCNEPWKSDINNYISSFLTNMNISLLQTEVPGVSNARNIGIDNAKGEFITFLDDDDYVSKDYLSSLLKKASTKIVALSNTLAFSDVKAPYCYKITENYKRIKNKEQLSINDARAYFSGPCMKLFHRSIVGENRFNVKLKNGEDTLFMFEISNNIKTVAPTVESAIYYRRVRENSATTGKRSNCEKRKSDLIQLLAILKAFYSHPLIYDFRFFMSRVVGCIYFIIKPIK